MSVSDNYYVYIYLDTRKPGDFSYEDLRFEFEPYYVGKGKGNRLRAHLSERLRKENPSHKNFKTSAILAAGLEPQILKWAESLSEEDSLVVEQKIIRKIGREDLGFGPLTNKTDGGIATSGAKFSDETKALLSTQRRGKKQTPAQYRANCSRIQSAEARRKISEANRVKRLSDEQYKQIAAKNKGKTRSSECRAAMSKQRKGKKQTPAQYAANCNRIPKPKYGWSEFQLLARSLRACSARQLSIALRGLKDPLVPGDPRAYYSRSGDWNSWRELFNPPDPPS